MYTFENPFEKSNRIYDNLLKGRSTKKYKEYIEKAVDVYKREGIHSLANKAIKKLFR
jgi:hypothetical protein